jgi:hypothetical protein
MAPNGGARESNQGAKGKQYELIITPPPPELMSLAAYVSDDGLVGHQWKERSIGCANFICLRRGECQGQEMGVGGWGSGGGGECVGDFWDSIGNVNERKAIKKYK